LCGCDRYVGRGALTREAGSNLRASAGQESRMNGSRRETPRRMDPSRRSRRGAAAATHGSVLSVAPSRCPRRARRTVADR